jgi:hypothetical protein
VPDAEPAWKFADFPDVKPVRFSPGMELTADVFHQFANYQAALTAAIAPPAGLRSDDRGIVDGNWSFAGGALSLTACALRTSRGFHLKVSWTSPTLLSGDGYKLWFGHDAEAQPVIRLQTPTDDKAEWKRGMTVDLGFIAFNCERGVVAPEFASVTAVLSWKGLSDELRELADFYRDNKFVHSYFDLTAKHLTGSLKQSDLYHNYPLFLGVVATGTLQALLDGEKPISFSATHRAAEQLVSSMLRVPTFDTSASPLPDVTGCHYERAIRDQLDRLPPTYRDYADIVRHTEKSDSKLEWRYSSLAEVPQPVAGKKYVVIVATPEESTGLNSPQGDTTLLPLTRGKEVKKYTSFTAPKGDVVSRTTSNLLKHPVLVLWTDVTPKDIPATSGSTGASSS